MNVLQRYSVRFGLAPTPKITPPFLDIDEILAKKKWENNKLSPEDIRSIQETIRFIVLVQSGMSVATQIAVNRKLSADSLAINAYNLASKGYHQFESKDKINLLELLDKTNVVLKNILSYDFSRDNIMFSNKDLELVYSFLRSIGRAIQSQTLNS